MAEQEVIKHVKAAIETARDKGAGWKHKAREILLEVAIIVFAVSLSIWLHGWAEGLKDRRDEREFLAGLKGDMKDNLQEMRGDRNYYQWRLRGTRYFERFVAGGVPLNQDSLIRYIPTFYSNSQFNPRGSRFEALKSSGRLGIIGNKNLLLQVTELYTKDFQAINMSNSDMNAMRTQLIMPFITQHLIMDSAGRGTNWPEVLRMSPMHVMIYYGEGAQACMNVYAAAMEKCEAIIREIDKELN